MSTLIVLIILFLLGMFGVGVAVETDCLPGSDQCSAAIDEDAWTPVTVDGIDGVIVPASGASIFVAADEYWTPTETEIADAEQAIADAQGELDHMRQYAGFVEDGDRKIYVNGFASESGIDWYSEPVFVMDGGEAYFQAVYNVETGVVEWFSFNGEA